MFGMRYVVSLADDDVNISRVEKTAEDDDVNLYPPGVMLAYYVTMSRRESMYLGDTDYDEATEVYVDVSVAGNKYIVDISIPPDSCVHDTVLMMVAQEISDHLLSVWVDALKEAQNAAEEQANAPVFGPRDRPTGWGGNREDIEA